MTTFLVVSALLLQAGSSPSPTIAQPDLAPHEGSWQVEVIDNIKVMPESRVTITIRGAAISGNGPCNTYRGTFTVSDGDRVRVGQLLKTMKACDPARMSEEADFFDLLQSVVGFEVRPTGVLELTTREGKTISSRRTAGSSQQ
jgi:hypothetical protein